MQLFMEHLVLPVVCPLLWRFFLRVSFNQGSLIKRWTSFCFKVAWFWLWLFVGFLHLYITIFVSFSKIEEQKMVVQFELENLDMKPDPEPALTDLIHAVSILNLKQWWCSGESTRLPPMSLGVRFWELALWCGSSLLLVLFSAPRGFSPRTVHWFSLF